MIYSWWDDNSLCWLEVFPQPARGGLSARWRLLVHAGGAHTHADLLALWALPQIGRRACGAGGQRDMQRCAARACCASSATAVGCALAQPM
ncbi:hypothetical protein NY97_24130 [Xanthomonas citri pv. fuscans]|nr:hypothetical protein NY97_24130 [Xanthomonas citri pv. fuscans]QWN13221.1 hypothetical protein DGN07_18300 [Xanthomonas citri pv. fuscans]